MMERSVKSSRVFRNSAVLMGTMVSPGRAGLGPPSPKSPWQLAQLLANNFWPTI